MTLQPVSFKKPVVHQPRVNPVYVPGKHSRMHWLFEEDYAVRRYYPLGGVAGVMPHIDRSALAIQNRAHVLGVVCTVTQQCKKQGPRDDSLDATVREEWSKLDGKKRGAVAALAVQLGVPRTWLTTKAIALGLVIPHKKEKHWTAAEVDLLSKAPIHSLRLAHQFFKEHGFQRSETAIKVKLTRIGLSMRAARPTLSASRAAKIIGTDVKAVTGDILSGRLAATKRDDKRVAQQGGAAWDITRADFRQYVIDNLERIDFRKVDKFELVDLLTNTSIGA